MKRCANPDCESGGDLLPLVAFSVDKRSPLGRTARCNACRRFESPPCTACGKPTQSKKGLCVDCRRSAECAVEWCLEAVDHRGWCATHYAIWLKCGNPVGMRQCAVSACERTRIGTAGPCQWHRDRFAVAGRQWCLSCNTAKLFDDFWLDGDGTNGRKSHCKACRKKARPPAFTLHGLTELEFNAIIAAQDGMCRCGAPWKVIDHDHSCCPGVKGCPKCVRGVLCEPCNKALGFASDDPSRLRRLADYLEKWQNKNRN